MDVGLPDDILEMCFEVLGPRASIFVLLNYMILKLTNGWKSPYDTHTFAAYIIERDYWVVIPMSTFPPKVPYYCPELIACGSRLFKQLLSSEAVGKLWELDVVSLAWNEVPTHPDAPVDWICC
ncbi:hypothetical protein LIER_35878 [Lithospermum erythrorhizon]|uniref:Uncharacterized protein n=1 Tax=Lithospermum erythrorhizon TaxID=34254 RepID=A0AAV3NYG7_LITER